MPWHTVTRLSDHLIRISEPLGAIEPRFGAGTVNMYLVLGRDRAALVDTGMGIGDVRGEVARLTDLPIIVLNTHYHWDHTGSNRLFAETAIHESEKKLVAHEPNMDWFRPAFSTPAAQSVLPEGFDPTAYRVIPRRPTQVLHDGDRIDLGGRTLEVLHIPGHTGGHVAFWEPVEGTLFTGDSAFIGSVFACFSGGDPRGLAASLKRMAALDGLSLTCPGHGDIITGGDWMGELADVARAAVAKEIDPGPFDAYVGGCRYRRGRYSVWLPG